MKILANFVYGTIKESLLPGGSFVFLVGLFLYHRARSTWETDRVDWTPAINREKKNYPLYIPLGKRVILEVLNIYCISNID